MTLKELKQKLMKSKGYRLERINDLIEDVEKGVYGTKNRANLLMRLYEFREWLKTEDKNYKVKRNVII